jgi:NAD(P)H-flavin reductase
MPLTLPIREVLDATPRARIIRLDLNGQAFAYHAGQAVLVRVDGDVKRRAYSLAAAPADAERHGWLELLVGVGGNPTAMDSIGPGATLEVDGPIGRFTFPSDDAARRLLFIAGGTGIAPLRAMLRQALSGPDHEIYLLYSARTCEDFAYREELEALAATGRIRLVQTVTRDPRDDSWNGGRGRIGASTLAPLVRDRTMLCFICGPMSFVTDTKRILADLGVPSECIRAEEW